MNKSTARWPPGQSPHKPPRKLKPPAGGAPGKFMNHRAITAPGGDAVGLHSKTKNVSSVL